MPQNSGANAGGVKRPVTRAQIASAGRTIKPGRDRPKQSRLTQEPERTVEHPAIWLAVGGRAIISVIEDGGESRQRSLSP